MLGLVLLAPSPPAGALPRRPSDHELKDVPPVYDARWWGWITDWDKLHEMMPDMTDDALEKMQEMLDGARESGSARRERMRGVAVDTSRIEVPSLVIAAGRDDVIHPTEARRTADLLGAAYEYFPSALALRAGDGGGDLAAGRRLRARLAGGAAPRDERAAGRRRGGTLRPNPPGVSARG